MNMFRFNLSESHLATDYSRVNIAQVAIRERALVELDALYEATRNGDMTALRFLEDLRDGRRRLYESMTTSDFVGLTSELAARRLRARFMAHPLIYTRIISVRSAPINNFKNVHSVRVDRDKNSTTFGQAIPEGGTFGYSSFKDSIDAYRVFKYIEGYRHSFELMLNDDLGGIAQILGYMRDDAVYIQELFAVKLFADANGPHASLYNATNGNLLTGNPAMSEASLELAFNTIGEAKDKSGRPIHITNGLVVVVGNKSLEARALRFKNAIETRRTEGDTLIVTANSLPDFDVVYNPYIASVVTSNLATSWWVMPRPVQGEIATRTWAEIGFLTGMRVPQLYRKVANTQLVGGGLQQNIGDFNTWSQEYAVATAFGGRQMEDTQVTVASNGSGS